MIRKSVALLVVAGVVYGCDTSTAPPAPRELIWVTQLEAVDGWDHISAEAAFGWVEGTETFRAIIEITGDTPGEVRPWHVNHGTCEQQGGIVGSDSDYPRLEISDNGTAQVIVDVPVGIDPAGSFHINVYESDDELEAIILCGDLFFLGAF